MLPFLKARKAPGVMMEYERRPDENEPDYGLESCAIDILHAIKSNDSKQLAEALRAAFEVLELEPHEESPHLE